MIAKVRNLRSLPALRYLVFCNVLHIICTCPGHPYYRVYQLYDNVSLYTLYLHTYTCSHLTGIVVLTRPLSHHQCPTQPLYFPQGDHPSLLTFHPYQESRWMKLLPLPSLKGGR